jgi:hypothetical protein
MDFKKILDHLRSELQNLDAAILSLERLQESARKRGRPPLTPKSDKNPKRPAKRPGAGRRGLNPGEEE